MTGKDDTSKNSSPEDQAYSSADDNENPFMCLVEAATSILDKSGDEPARKDNGSPTSTDQDLKEASKETSRPSTPSTPSKHIQDDNKKHSFAEHLMAVLDDESNSDILTWMPDGNAFTIINPKKFTLVDMPKLFNIRNMSSFVRKLGRWGFHRVHEKETRNSDIFKHEYFQRGNFELCAKIKCVGRKESPPSPKLVPTVKASQSKYKPSVAKSLAAPVSPPTPPKNSSSAQDQLHALNYLNRARVAQEQLQHRSMASSSSMLHHPSSLNNMTSEVLNAAMETLHRDQTPRLPPGLAHLAGLGGGAGLGLPSGLSPASTGASGLSTSDLLAIQRLIKAEQMAQQHARMPAYLTAAELHALQNSRANVWGGGFPGLF